MLVKAANYFREMLRSRDCTYNPEPGLREEIYCSFTIEGYAEARDPFTQFITPALRSLVEALPDGPLVFYKPYGKAVTVRGVCLGFTCEGGVITYKITISSSEEISEKGLTIPENVV